MLPRRKQREILLQFLFSWEYSDALKGVDICSFMARVVKLSRRHLFSVREKLIDVTDHLDHIDQMLKRASSGYALERISKVDKNILRIAAYEILFEKLDANVVVSEAIRLSKKFSSPEAVSYVHAVVDEMIKYENMAMEKKCIS